MSGRTADQAIWVGDSQDYGRQMSVISDQEEDTTSHSDSEDLPEYGQPMTFLSHTEEETIALSGSKVFIRDLDTEEAIILSSDSEEKTQDAGSEQEGVVNPNSEEEGDSGQGARVASVETKQAEWPHLSRKTR